MSRTPMPAQRGSVVLEGYVAQTYFDELGEYGQGPSTREDVDRPGALREWDRC